MDRIYKTKYGNWIDLSLIEEISEFKREVSFEFDPIVLPKIILAFQEKSIILDLQRDNVTLEQYIQETKEAFNDLLSAWKQFTSEHPELQIIKPIVCNCGDNVKKGTFICVHGNYFNIE